MNMNRRQFFAYVFNNRSTPPKKRLNINPTLRQELLALMRSVLHGLVLLGILHLLSKLRDIYNAMRGRTIYVELAMTAYATGTISIGVELIKAPKPGGMQPA